MELLVEGQTYLQNKNRRHHQNGLQNHSIPLPSIIIFTFVKTESDANCYTEIEKNIDQFVDNITTFFYCNTFQSILPCYGYNAA